MNVDYPVCISFDENYLFPACVTICSLLENAFPQTFYKLYIITDGPCAEYSLPYIEKIFEKYPRHSYEFLRPLPVMEGAVEKKHLTISNYNRFAIPTLLSTLDKVLWIDVDVVVNRDISDLFKLDLGENIVAAARMNPPMKQDFVSVNEYYNAGVLLFNINKWDEVSAQRELIDLIGNNEFERPTQDPLNILTNGRTEYVDFKYNILLQSNHPVRYLERCFGARIEEVLKDAYIYHFVDRYKPWNYKNHFFFQEWYKYYKMLPFENVDWEFNNYKQVDYFKIAKLKLRKYKLLKMVTLGVVKKITDKKKYYQRIVESCL